MDSEMIERCVAAAKAKRYELINAPLERCYEDIIMAVVKAMRDPTQAQYDALCATNKVWRDLDSLTIWQTYVDAIVGDK